MNILFLMKYPTCLPETLKRKFDGQMNACINLGNTVWYIEWDGARFLLVNKSTGEKTELLRVKPVLSLEKYYHTLFFIDLYRAANKALRICKFECVYMRSMPVFPPLGRFARNLEKNGIFFIDEIPTFLANNKKEVRETDGLIRKLGTKASSALASTVQKHVNLFTAIGDDTHGTLHNKPAMNIDNGISVSTIPTRCPDLVDDTLNFLLLASMCFWHGYDRIITSLKTYSGDKKIKFHFVGNDGDGSLAKWKALASDLAVDEYVEFHGAIYGEALDEFINTMDVGIGSLGLYRNGLETASILKAREYMSRGLPFVYSGTDPMIDETLPYVMRVSNDDSNIDIKALAEFAEKTRTLNNVPEEMRKYAKSNMSWETQFERTFEKMSSLRGGEL